MSIPSWRKWPVRVKTKRKGAPTYFTRWFRTRQGYDAWSLPKDEVFKSVEFRA